jgi:hypothetical protein
LSVAGSSEGEGHEGSMYLLFRPLLPVDKGDGAGCEERRPEEGEFGGAGHGRCRGGGGGLEVRRGCYCRGRAGIAERGGGSGIECFEVVPFPAAQWKVVDAGRRDSTESFSAACDRPEMRTMSSIPLRREPGRQSSSRGGAPERRCAPLPTPAAGQPPVDSSSSSSLLVGIELRNHYIAPSLCHQFFLLHAHIFRRFSFRTYLSTASTSTAPLRPPESADIMVPPPPLPLSTDGVPPEEEDREVDGRELTVCISSRPKTPRASRPCSMYVASDCPSVLLRPDARWHGRRSRVLISCATGREGGIQDCSEGYVSIPIPRLFVLRC